MSGKDPGHIGLLVITSDKAKRVEEPISPPRSDKELREQLKQLEVALSKLQFDGDQRGDFESEVRAVRAAIDSASRLMRPH